MGRILIFVGLTLVLSGLLFQVHEKFGLENLPGNFTLKGDQYELKIPLMTCLIISGILSALMWIWRKIG